MSIGDHAATGVVYVISAMVLWAWTRKSNVRYIRWQWRKPWWMLLRLLVLVLVFHALFALLGVHPALGFLCMGLFAAVSIAADFSGVFAAVIAAVGCVSYEWIFWLPSRRQLILRNPRRIAQKHRDEMIGLEGIVVSDLKPTGIITVEGINRSARSGFGLIAKGEKVVIDSVGDFEVNVRKSEGQQDDCTECRNDASIPN